MRDIRIVIVTIDRAPRENYLHYTLQNLVDSGLHSSKRLDSIHVVDSGSPPAEDQYLEWPDRAIDPSVHGLVHIHDAPERRSGKQNSAAALRIGAEGHDGWVLHMEDDLAFCADFVDGVGRWLDRFEGDGLVLPRVPIYPFSGDNARIRTAVVNGESAWDYPVAWFWGLQCFACRPDVALDLAQWFEEHPIYVHSDGRKDENAHDLEMHHWARERGYTYFRGSCPSFVQHIGFETSIAGNVMGGARVTFPSWPGREWRFE